MTPIRSTLMTCARVVTIGLLMATIAGCTSRMGELENYITEVKQRPAPPLDPLPPMQEFETFEYQAHHLRDPFANPVDKTAKSGGPGPDPNRRKEPLEAYPLDGLDMVGTLGGGDSLVGLIMDPERVIHRVVVGNYMGQNDGRITSVSQDKIELEEYEPDGAGGWNPRHAEVALDDN